MVYMSQYIILWREKAFFLWIRKINENEGLLEVLHKTHFSFFPFLSTILLQPYVKSFLEHFQKVMVFYLVFSVFSGKYSLKTLSRNNSLNYGTHSRWFQCVLFTKSHHSHYPVTACLVPICSLYGAAVTTVEGVGSIKTRIHPVQVRVQCGGDPVLVSAPSII